MLIQRRFYTLKWLLVSLLLLSILPLPAPKLAFSQATPTLRIESDDARIARTGEWMVQPTASASGGNYVYNVGEATLALEFSGTALEVIYLAGPTLGTLAIEVDDTVLRTVITTDTETHYAQSAKIDYLTDEPHTLKVYAQAGGTIAVDAFVVAGTIAQDTLVAASNDDPGGVQSACDSVTVTQRVSERTGNIQANFDSFDIVLSDDGRYAAFASYATDIIPFAPGPFSTPQVYYRDRQTCTTVRVSLDSSGQQSNPGASFSPAISSDGRYVAFSSTSTTLVSGDTNASTDVFVRDMQAGTTIRVNVATNGTQANSGGSGSIGISNTGRYITFVSDSSNLVTGDTNTCDVPGEPVELVPCSDVFVRDRDTDTDGIFDEAGSVSTFRASVASGGTQANNYSFYPAISGNGRFVTFASTATNLVASDTNGSFDIFVRDTQTGTTTRESVSTAEAQANAGSLYPVISDDGRYVAFRSTANNLVASDTNGQQDIFVRDRTTTTTTRVSVATGGTEANGYSDEPSISADGRYVAFHAGATNLVTGDTNATADVFLHDRNTTTTTRVSLSHLGAQGNAVSFGAGISGNGLVVGFTSDASNLVLNDTNARQDAFVYDPNALVPPSGLVATALSQSQIQLTWNDSPNETFFYVERSLDGVTGWVELRQLNINIVSFLHISQLCNTRYYYRVRAFRASDSRYSAYTDVANALTLPCPTPCNRTTTAHRVSLAHDNAQANAISNGRGISADGRFVLFDSAATNLVPNDTNAVTDAFLRDRQTCQVWRISASSVDAQLSTGGTGLDISPDARYVVFASATPIGQGDFNSVSDIFVLDRLLGNVTRASAVNASSLAGNGATNGPAQITPDGRYVVFQSDATNLVTSDTNAVTDIFVRDTQAGTTTRISVSDGEAQASALSIDASMSDDGRYIVFTSDATNLVTGDTNATADVFLRDAQAGTTTRVSVATGGTQGNGLSVSPKIAGNGNFIVFQSEASNLVTGDTNATSDIFLYTRQAPATTRVSVSTSGVQSNDGSITPFISTDGRIIAFASTATNLVGTDTNGVRDIFTRDTLLNLTSRVNVQVGGVQDNGIATSRAISDNGRFMVFDTPGSALVTGDTNGITDSFAARVPRPNTPAIFRPDVNAVSLINTTQDLPPLPAYYTFTTNPPVTDPNSFWVMGDWDGDGEDTPGQYSGGIFRYTNDLGPLVTWRGLWIGLAGRPVVAGRFDPNVANDCIGAVDSANFPPYGTAFALYFTCDLTIAAPTLVFQWLSILLPDSQGHSGPHQFAVGDYNNDGVESVAARRGPTIAFTNTPPLTLVTEFTLAQYFGTPETTDGGILVAGDWNNDSIDSFGLFYSNGNFQLRNDLDWNSGVFILQRVGQPLGNLGLQAGTWR